ncbi:DMP19 family protein [Undibacterium sp. Ji83W]|uniref:DMP19 family protein n=1 Tax=Undibacterium sp. Ji83W TaxID=3413043 RepID=UPI003BF243A2
MKKYTPISDTVFDQPDDHFLFESIFYHLLKKFDNLYPPIEVFETASGMPECAKVAWCLWQFAAEVSGNGIPDYLLNHCPEIKQLIFTHHALKLVLADELVVLLEAAIPLAREASIEYGEFSDFPKDAWLDQFQVNLVWPDLEMISQPSWALSAAPLSSLVGTYLRAHRAALQNA